MGKTTKVRMAVSIGGFDERGRIFSAQPGEVVAVSADLAKKWLRGGHATPVDQAAPVTPPDGLADLSAAEALRHRCVNCDKRRAKFVFRNHPLCAACYRAQVEL